MSNPSTRGRLTANACRQRPRKLHKGCEQALLTVTAFTGARAGPQLDLPHDVTPTQLETLLNGLLASEERLPYSFFVNNAELGEELGAHLFKHNVSVETALHIVYQPQAVFRVRPVSRCTASMPGSPWERVPTWHIDMQCPDLYRLSPSC